MPQIHTFNIHVDTHAYVQLRDEQWDIIVLQDNSAVPGGADASKFNAAVQSLQDFFVPMLRRHQSTARIILFSTWGHRAGSVYKEFLPSYPDFRMMQLRTVSLPRSLLVGL